MEQKVTVIGVRKLDFADRETGEMIQGVKVYFLDKNAEQKEDVKGLLPSSAFIKDLSAYDSFQHVPGEYNARLTFDLVGNKPKVRYAGFDYISPAKV